MPFGLFTRAIQSIGSSFDVGMADYFWRTMQRLAYSKSLGGSTRSSFENDPTSLTSHVTLASLLDKSEYCVSVVIDNEQLYSSEEKTARFLVMTGFTSGSIYRPTAYYAKVKQSEPLKYPRKSRILKLSPLPE